MPVVICTKLYVCIDVDDMQIVCIEISFRYRVNVNVLHVNVHLQHTNPNEITSISGIQYNRKTEIWSLPSFDRMHGQYDCQCNIVI